MNAKQKAVSMRRRRKVAATTTTLGRPDRPQKTAANSEWILKPTNTLPRCWKTKAAEGSSQACVKTKLWLGRDAIKRFVFWAGPVNYSFQKMVQMEG